MTTYHEHREEEAEKESKGKSIPTNKKRRKDVIPEHAGAVVTRKSDKS